MQSITAYFQAHSAEYIGYVLEHLKHCHRWLLKQPKVWAWAKKIVFHRQGTIGISGSIYRNPYGSGWSYSQCHIGSLHWSRWTGHIDVHRTGTYAKRPFVDRWIISCNFISWCGIHFITYWQMDYSIRKSEIIKQK